MDATVHRYYDDTHTQLRQHLQHPARCLQLRAAPEDYPGLNPYEFICKC